ncbi:dimethylhistidine N-methyltransferase [Methylopila capsulata]|uniref:Dimethylhistidine N-methyltransferase n=1 Tax=Methylopila capsulata TaxID=61654 RepID=A0A9W6MS60_9HYPH|nr:L-histidine N(alpha)-methyltransferase [Methylopila capsulata]MBM7850670.1 dimethylhistidine N-methyltransferase [Methylopila capsulata]GLK55963.1 dimethylhistidine N-methyltransferase [Methylopila capsulata]
MLDRAPLQAAQREAFRADVLEGLSKPAKTLPSRWLYDDRGSELFEEITQLPEYYPTRTETAILRAEAEAIAAFCGPRATLIEYGAGAGVKTEIVLAALDNPASYVPVDIAGDFLALSAERLEQRFPWLEIRPVVADFTDDFDLPSDLPRLNRRIGFFPGSTIGNLSPAQAVAFLAQVGAHVGDAGRAVVGVDLVKPLDRLVPAYDDAAGVTAAFNLNLLVRINRELDGTFDPARFAHEARWNAEEQAIEMHIRSLAPQVVAVAGREIAFAEGETIHTESSRKYGVDAFVALAAEAGWRAGEVWRDADGLFAVVGLKRAA